MNIRFYNARILTMEQGTALQEGELWVQDGLVSHVGPRREEMPLWDREINCEGNLLMPGFKNAHTHSAMTFLRSYADDLPLQAWLFEQVFPMEAKLNGQDVYDLSRLAILEYLTSGITADFDMYFYRDDNIRASVDMGFRTVLCGALTAGDSLERAEQEYLRFNACHPLISAVLGFHAEYTADDALVEGLAALAKKHGSAVYAHNSETALEVQQCIERHGMTPTVYMESKGLFVHGGGGFHCVHMSDADLEIFKARGLYAVTNPASNAKLASGIAPLQRMSDMGIGLAIGTDGPASNNCLDMFREMFLATALQKLANMDASAMAAEKVLEMATVGGARAMGLTDCDTLAVGKRADLIMIDLHRPNMQPMNHIQKNLVYSGSKENVALTMINGRILYERGSFFVNADPEEIYAKANEIIGRYTKA